MRQGSKDKIMHGLSAVQAARSVLTDEQAAECKDLYPDWKIGIVYDPDGVEGPNRFTYNGILYKALTKHTSQADWIPGSVPAVYAEVLPGQDGTAIGEWKQPDSTNPYKKGDRVTHNGKIWENIVEDTEDGKGRNVWEPGVYGWVEVG